MSKGSGVWEIWSVWNPSQMTRMEEVRHPARDQDETGARREGSQLACCAGIRLVEVIRPDGQVASIYSRSDNRWRDYPHDTTEEESQRLIAEDCG